ncbi:MAG: hypothetical protein ACFE9C_05330 [Candidatus Hodarchaeota archaeon]
MKEITEVLTVFFNIFRNDILEYYQKTQSYLRDLIVYKKIDLNKKIETNNDIQIKNTLEVMLKAVKTGLNTIGIPIEKLNENQKKYLETLDKERVGITDYNSYFRKYLENYVNILLFEILIDYLVNIDEKKLENANLFDLLPPYFISKLNEFKRSHFSNKDTIEMFKQNDYKKYFNFKNLTVIKPIDTSGDNILGQLRQVKEGFIETLKTPKKEILKQTIQRIKEEENFEKVIPQIKGSKAIPQIEQELDIVLNTNTFIDYYGDSIPVHPDILNKFDIDKLNLINLKVVNLEFFDLESLFYYICILKMLNLEIPFNQMEILEIMKSFINNWVFCASHENVPDSINNFYGLSIFSELNLIPKTNIIDLQEIENFILSELTTFIPEKLQVNLYSILCMKLIIKIQKKFTKRKLNLEPISDYKLLEMVNFKPTLDIFNHLSSLKLLGKEDIINNLKIAYAHEIKKKINADGSVDDLISESARALLIFELLNLKELESNLCNKLMNFILTKTSFFTAKNLDSKFSWRSDKLGLKIELQMLYWALLASSRYNSIMS